MRAPRSAALAVAAALASCAPPPVPAPAAPPVATPAAPSASAAPSPAPDAAAPLVQSGPVIVSIVVDQLAAWVLDERLDALPTDGGFARLAREGTRVRRMTYAHAVTDTAPGHAALYTGATPSRTGVFGNEVFDAEGKRTSILRDPGVQLVGAKGPLGRAGSSPARLAVPTVSEAFLAARPRGRVVSISWKDRGAILPAGHVSGDRAAVLWFDMATDGLVTSTAFAPELPAFARAELAAHPASAFRRDPWTPLDPAWLAAHVKTADAAPGEGDLEGLGVTFPHAIPSAKAMRATPASDAMLLSMAVAALSEPRTGPTLLLLSLSANDYVGHVFGPDSWEAWDELRRLDRALAGFFTWLDARLGEGGWSAVLSADHGTVPLPETLAALPVRKGRTCDAADAFGRPCTGTRILPDELGARLRKVSPAVVGICDPWVFFREEIRADPKARRAAERAVVAALAREPGVARAIPASWLAERCGALAAGRGAGAAPDVDALVCASWSPGAGDVYVVPKVGAFFDPLQVVGKGMSHGSPYAYDRTVPLLVRAPGSVARGAIVDEAPFEAFRAALEALLGLAPAPAWAAPAAR